MGPKSNEWWPYKWRTPRGTERRSCQDKAEDFSQIQGTPGAMRTQKRQEKTLLWSYWGSTARGIPCFRFLASRTMGELISVIPTTWFVIPFSLSFIFLQLRQQRRWFTIHMLHSATAENRTSPECHRSRTKDQNVLWFEPFWYEQGGSLKGGLGDQGGHRCFRSFKTNSRQ